MGTLFWQLNDCWPVTSWSTIDYYFNRKASFYCVKQAYADILISVLEDNGSLQTWFINDKQYSINATLSYTLMTTTGKIITEKQLPVILDAASAVPFTAINTKYFLEGYAPENCVLYMALTANDSVLAENVHLFAPEKSVSLQEPEFSISFNTEKNTITISANTYVRAVYLYTEGAELVLSDNFFDLLPSAPKEISLQCILPENPESIIKIKSLNTLYH